ncbi:MAG: M56 family metallopeptidase [Ferruginibacter sp.]
MVISFTWFVYTIIENYAQLLNSPHEQSSILPNILLNQLQKSNQIFPFLSILYFSMLGLFSFQFVKKLIANQLLQCQGLSKPIFDIRLFTSRTARHLGIKKKIQVWISKNVDVPSVTGFFKPIILLPAAIVNDLSVNQLEAILIHELAHIKRNDYLINLSQSVIETVMFFNPFVLLFGKVARKERENCCDDWVLNYQYDQHHYASALLQIEERRHFKLALVLAATDNKKILLQRIKRLFNTSKQSSNMSKTDRLKFIGLTIVLFLGILTTIPKLNIENKVDMVKSSVPKLDNNISLAPVLQETSVNKHEITGENVIKTDPVLTTSSEKTTSKATIKNVAVKPDTKTYLNAYINEELLPGNTNTEPAITMVADKEINEKKYFIKIEEQASGNSQTNTYYLELNNKNGEPNLKPLIILEKVKMSTRRIKLTKIADSTLIKSVKTRITS